MRQVFCSKEVAFQASQSPAKVVKVYSMFPVDKPTCDCQKLIREWQVRLGEATQKERQQLVADNPVITCPRDKSNMKRYEILCKGCGQRQGYAWATDPSMKDWCDFHYVQWTPGDYWRGCFTPHISPVTLQLCFECCCGQDTRDFRANMSLPERVAMAKEARNSVGRDFGLPNSKFYVQVAQ